MGSTKFVIYKRVQLGSHMREVYLREYDISKRFIKQDIKRAKRELGPLYGGYYFTTRK